MWSDMLNSIRKSAAVELLRLASLRIRFSLKEVLDPAWASVLFPDDVFSRIPITLCSLYPLFLDLVSIPVSEEKEETETEELWQFVVPQICMEVISSHDSRLPIFPVHESTDMGEHLEVIARNCMRLRVSDQFVRTRGRQFKDLFSFLRGSFIADLKPDFKTMGTFPKIVDNDNSCPQLDEAAIKNIMQRAGKGHNDLPNVRWSQLDVALQCMSRDVLSKPMGKSHSGDLLWLSQDRYMFETQLKAGDQLLMPSLCVDELHKSTYQCIGTSVVKLTFMFVFTAKDVVSSTFLKHASPSPVASQYLWKFGSGTVFSCERNETQLKEARRKADSDSQKSQKPCSFTVPAGMEVLILTSEGTELLLGVENLRALRNFKDSIRAAALVLSPLKEKRPS